MSLKLLIAALATACTLVAAPQVFAGPGDLDPSFGSNGKVFAEMTGIPGNGLMAMVVQADGKIVAGRGSEENQLGFQIVRFNADGTIDTGFGSSGVVQTPIGSGYAITSSIVEQPGGKLLAAGFGSVLTLVRYDSNGSLDPTFGTGGVVSVSGWTGGSQESARIVQRSDGRLLVAGGSKLGRFLADGTPDATFGTAGIVSVIGCDVTAIAEQPDHKIVVGGQPYGVSSATHRRYNEDGTVDGSFGSAGGVNVLARPFGLAVQSDGKILSTNYATAAPYQRLEVTRLNSDGTFDTLFGSSGHARALIPGTTGWDSETWDVLVQSDQKILISGSLCDSAPVLDYVCNFALARFHSDGSLDTSFGDGGTVLTPNAAYSGAYAMRRQADGRIVVSGAFSTTQTERFGLARYFGQDCGNGLPEIPELCDDGNATTGDGCESDCTLTPEAVSGTPLANEAISTDAENDGATGTDPIETTIVTPAGGAVTIDETGDAPAGISGYQMVGTAIQITAPVATPASPLDFRFTIDASMVPPGITAAALQVFRNGTLVPDCPGGTAGGAVPDPCVAERLALSGGDIQIRVFTSAASEWAMGVGAACGDSLLNDGEQCDDGGLLGGDGCDATCQIEDGWACESSCSPVCGDRLVVGGEQCDDGNQNGGDCCAGSCTFESTGASCLDDGSVCTTDLCDASGTCVHAPGNIGQPCRAAAGECDAAESCSGLSASCPTDAKVAAGTGCQDDGNSCTDDVCDGAQTSCTHPANSVPCDDGLFCNGADTCSGGSCSAHSVDPCAGGAACANQCNESADNCFATAGAPCPSDGNVCTDDVCDGAGICGTANSASCSDGDFCTVNDSCSAGSCSGVARSCEDGDLCTADSCDESADTCVHDDAPVAPASCLAAPKAKLQIARATDPSKNKLSWQWSSGVAFAHADLGAPTTSTRYALCIHDMAASAPSLQASVDIAFSSSLWKSLEPKGFDYKDKDGTSDGVARLQLRPGEAGKSKVKLSAKGATIPMPLPAGSSYFTQAPMILVQLINSDGRCWTSEFAPADTTTNDADSFKAQVK